MARQLGEQPLLGLLDLLVGLLDEPDQLLLPSLQVVEPFLALLDPRHQGSTPHLQLGLGGERGDGGLDLLVELGLGGERGDGGLELVLALQRELLLELLLKKGRS